ncbi:hypothetical protein EZJ49_13095 [Bdellovibrio bacteriovorus]|uniref:Ppx/GppA phosphatase family protein n=1 Tax=Bdellovibrio bacteriovorus TaxID=959 RepID=UPI0021CE182E|nr:hypothetical protein [Bdellovibrio bacteriovorus]UXR64000.1 hypothetical protein EZJ49_13095 [Bdellovibrio bacteriovorus]
MKKIFVLISLSSVTVWAKPCVENRAALDLGSGTTKAYVATVDTCEKKIVKVIFEERLPLAFNEALEKSPDGTLPEKTVQEATPRIQALLGKVRTYDVKRITAVATSVFRVAKNGRAVAQRLARDLQVPVEVISQEQEAELGYWSALAQKNISDTRNLIVWDIGGGSMQMYSRDKGKVHIYEGDLASVTFKNKILQVLQFKDPKDHSSPNPIGRQREASLQLAKNHAYLNVPEFFKKMAPTARWVGVGGVISLSVQRQVNKDASEFTQAELSDVLKKRVWLNDAEINSDYRISDISNLALVLGYMQALKVEKVETAQASLGQGLIFKNLK